MISNRVLSFPKVELTRLVYKIERKSKINNVSSCKKVLSEGGISYNLRGTKFKEYKDRSVNSNNI